MTITRKQLLKTQHMVVHLGRPQENQDIEPLSTVHKICNVLCYHCCWRLIAEKLVHRSVMLGHLNMKSSKANCGRYNYRKRSDNRCKNSKILQESTSVFC